jgi:RNA polymerase sigma factor (sigma-70 family)
MQLRFTPESKRRQQLRACERLLGLIDADKEYPFEFVCFHITDFRPKGLEDQQLVKGRELLEDLRVFISKLSGQLAERVSQQGQKVYSTQELADKFDISTKTIYRWRKRGLPALKFVFDDGRKRLGFLQSSVDKFVEQNPQLIEKAKVFKQLTGRDKETIIKRARTLAAKSSMSRYQIIEKIAAEIGRVHETVRYTLENYEKQNPEKRVFKKPSGVISPAQAAELYRVFRQGVSIGELMERFNRSKSSIYRIVNRRRARMLLSRKLEFIASDEFFDENAKEMILGDSVIADSSGGVDDSTSAKGQRLPMYYVERFGQIKRPVLLSRDDEVALFRRYNYLKFLVSQSRGELRSSRLSSARIKQIEELLAEAELIKNRIIEANLGLVVSIARKHILSGVSLLDLVSEGNFSMMRAVEKFDYTRGVRFATYASWAIVKDYARKLPAKSDWRRKGKTSFLADVQRDMRTPESAGVLAVERAHKSLVEVIKNELNEREQYVIINHFGLLGSLIRKQKKTLKQIGEDLGLTKERIRQIELVALQKLKHRLSIEEFELLTG